MIDTHCHLDQTEFDVDRDEVVRRAQAAGVEALVAVAVTADSSDAILKFIADRAGLFAAVGIHPNYTHQAVPGDWERIEALVDRPKVVGLGETGLDKHWDYAPFPLQQDYFDRHIRLSQRTGLPFIVHARDCEADVVAMLEAARVRGPLRGVMHSFAGEATTAARCLELGMYVSFAGMVTFKKSESLRTIAASIPDDRLLVETDSPYLSPQPLRGKRNEPANVAHTLRLLAEVRETTFEKLDLQTTVNARRLFDRLR
ncbi:MAG: TatD family hydrolase [Planctomycetia bacterium]|nr:TatD family hydrolase [Planctomycetia bacterium]